MNRLLLILCVFLLTTSSITAQNARLFGVIANALYSVDHKTADTKKIVDIRVPRGVMMRDLTYHDKEQAFFSFTHFMTAPRLVCFSWDGSFKDVGPLNINGRPVSMIEAIDYNEADGHVYASVSTDGPDDFSETIVRVNIKTASCNPVGSLISVGRDADDFAFWSGKLYIKDGIPEKRNVLYTCQVSKSELRIEQENQVNYRRIIDMTALNGFLYGTDAECRLVRYQLDGSDMVVIGGTHVPLPDNWKNRMMGLATVKLAFVQQNRKLPVSPFYALLFP